MFDEISGEYSLGDPRNLPLRSGIDWSSEDEAERILTTDRRAPEMPLDPDYQILTRDQELLRRQREVLGPYGAPDRSAGPSGMYRRAFNPLAGQRPVKLKQGDE